MRIVFDHQAFSAQPFGGASRYVIELVTHLQRLAGVEVRVLAGVHRNQLVQHQRLTGFEGWYVPRMLYTARLRNTVNTLFTRRRLRRVRPDIVHETYYRSGRPYAPGVPSVVTVFDCIHFRFDDEESKDPGSRERLRAAVERADLVICISHSTRDDLVRFVPVAADKLRIVHLGVSSLPQPPALWRRPERPFVLHVGRRDGYKNFELVVRAFAAAEDLRRHYDIVCFGGEELSAAERRHYVELGVPRSHIIAWPERGDDVLSALYRNAVALAYPSLCEGFGLPPLEAMSVGCPVICGDRSSLPEIAGDAALMIDPQQPAALVDAIRSVATAPTRDRLVAAGAERVRQFSWERCARETLEAYRSLLPA